MSGKAFTAHFDGGKLHGQTMPLDGPAKWLSIPYFQHPGRHTHTIHYKLVRVDGAQAFYEPSQPHVTERYLA